MRRLGPTLLALGVLVGCAARWPDERREAFTRSCLANARRTRPTAPEDALVAYCNCAVERLQERYSPEEFSAIEAESVREKKPAMELVRVVEECATRLR